MPWSFPTRASAPSWNRLPIWLSTMSHRKTSGALPSRSIRRPHRGSTKFGPRVDMAFPILAPSPSSLLPSNSYREVSIPKIL